MSLDHDLKNIFPKLFVIKVTLCGHRIGQIQYFAHTANSKKNSARGLFHNQSRNQSGQHKSVITLNGSLVYCFGTYLKCLFLLSLSGYFYRANIRTRFFCPVRTIFQKYLHQGDGFIFFLVKLNLKKINCLVKNH
jgi:hypothetical protein